MNKKVSISIFILLLVPYIPLNINSLTTLYVNPSITKISVDDTFSINITVSDVNDLAGWEIKLYYLSAYLNGTNVEEGPFLKQGGSTFFDCVNFTDNYNSTHGIVWATCTLLGTGPGVNGNGTLAIVTFKAKTLGTSILSLSDTALSDSQPDPKPIPHETMNGIAYVLPHDVAITSVMPSKSIVGQGFSTKINVSVSNKGNFTETFNVTVYVNTTSIPSQNVALSAGNSATITFTWNSTGFAYGNYTIKAVADTVSNETETEDNTLIANVTIHVGVPGDVSSITPGAYDYIVNIRDISYLVQRFQTKPTSPNWKPNADINNDDVVNIRDINIAVQYFQEHE